MTLSSQFAALHARAFSGAARWSEQAFASALQDPMCFVLREGGGDHADLVGFAIGRAVADEAELLTLVVQPHDRRQGVGRDLLKRFEASATLRGARAFFLEVSAENSAARSLYEKNGWKMVGQRTGYYDGVDAIAMRKEL